MDNEVMYAANEAVNGLQLSNDKAVRFVMRNAKVSELDARQAVNKVEQKEMHYG